MKNILRKLHIGSSVDGGGRALDARSPSPGLLPSPSSTAAARTGASTGTAAGTSEEDVLMDYNYFEEEYQVQLALAISASSSNTDSISNDPESLQISAAKRISLGHSPSPSPANTPAEFLAHRYWSYNVVDYDEKVMDGFYDVYGILSDPNSQGKMPSLVELQGTPVSDNIGYEVVLVNRIIDPALEQLEQKALGISLELKAADLGPLDSGLVQGVADLVAEHMGGAVNDADDMLTRWTLRSYGLRSTLNNIVLPLGRLQIGLSRHRALLFKVLADRVGIKCRLVKGSHYTGTDDGAINIIKLDCEREFIIDLMGAPGALIPVETTKTVHAQGPVLDKSNTGQVIIAQAVQDLCSTLEEKDIGLFVDRRDAVVQSNNDSGDYKSKVEKSNFDAAASRVLESGMKDVKLNERPQFHCIEHAHGKSNSPFNRPRRSPSWTEGVASPAEQMKVKNVSQCVIAANENPEFAQRLHAVLLESGDPAPPNLFDDISSQQFAGQIVSQHKGNNQEKGAYEFQRRREKLPSGPGRPPQPIMRKNSTTRNGVGENSQVQFVDRLELRRVPAERIDSVSGDLSPIVATSKCCQPLTKGPGLVENANITSATLANQKHTGVDNVVQHNLVDREHTFNRGRRELMESESMMHGESVDSRNNADELGPSISSCNTRYPLMDDVTECEIPWENLLIGERIGLGSYGEVYHADWNGTEVAVKKFLDQDFSGDALEQFRSEVRIMQRLRHPNIVLFMGAVTRPPHLSILTEFLPRGSLYKLLHRPNIQIDEKRRLRMALDVAKGMNYLHTSNPTIVHRDLKSPNLLVDKNWNVKVCDFGLSRLKHHTFLSSKSTAGTPEWMAPEVLRNELSNEKCDVYSFGVILWELATLRMPWSGMNPMQVVGAVGFQDRRLDIPKEVDPMVARIISACWQNDPSLRPSFAQLMASLKPLQRLVILPQLEL